MENEPKLNYQNRESVHEEEREEILENDRKDDATQKDEKVKSVLVLKLSKNSFGLTQAIILWLTLIVTATFNYINYNALSKQLSLNESIYNESERAYIVYQVPKNNAASTTWVITLEKTTTTTNEMINQYKVLLDIKNVGSLPAYFDARIKNKSGFISNYELYPTKGIILPNQTIELGWRVEVKLNEDLFNQFLSDNLEVEIGYKKIGDRAEYKDIEDYPYYTKMKESWNTNGNVLMNNTYISRWIIYVAK